jgi:hypothetical protein
MARCCRLLVLWGPQLSEQLESVLAFVTWFLLGGTAAGMDALAIGETASDLNAVPESIDVFAAARLQLSRARTDEHVRAQLEQALALAPHGWVNELVRAQLASVRQAALAAIEALPEVAGPSDAPVSMELGGGGGLEPPLVSSERSAAAPL